MLQLTNIHTTTLEYNSDGKTYYFEVVETVDTIDNDPVWDCYMYGLGGNLRGIRFPLFSCSKSKCSFSELLTILEDEADDHVDYIHRSADDLENGIFTRINALDDEE